MTDSDAPFRVGRKATSDLWDYFGHVHHDAGVLLREEACWARGRPQDEALLELLPELVKAARAMFGIKLAEKWPRFPASFYAVTGPAPYGGQLSHVLADIETMQDLLRSEHVAWVAATPEAATLTRTAAEVAKACRAVVRSGVGGRGDAGA